MLKQVQFRGVSESGQINCLPLLGATPSAALEKTASAGGVNLHPTIKKFVNGVKSTPKGIYVLVSALGSSEFWGSNVNGDDFPEAGLIHSPPEWEKLSIDKMKQEGAKWDYGFPTFMRAHPFKHHVNKDASRAFGDVVLAVWNPKMHRVELVVYLDREKCKKFGAIDIIERIERGEFPDVSMGCKVPFDICTICGHKSKTTKDYCTHAKTMMNKILPDGRKVAVVNDKPKFFDISFVFIGADKSAKVMAKLANKGNQVCMGEYCSIPRLSGDVGESYIAPEIQEKLAADAVEELFMEKAAGARADFHNFYLNKSKEAPWSNHIEIADGTEEEGRDALTSWLEGDAPGAEKQAEKQCPCPRLGTSGCCIGVMEKEASSFFQGLEEKSASHRKLSEIIKNVPAGPFFERDLPRVEKAEADLPNNVLDHLAKLPLGDALSAPSSLGMVLKPREFQRIILIQIGERPLADRMDSMGSVFGHTGGIDPMRMSPLGGLGSLLSLLLPFLAARSCATPLLKKRMAKLAHKESSLTPISGDETLDKISSMYNGYRQELAKKAAAVESQLTSEPQLLHGIAGNSIAQAFGGGFRKTASCASVLGPESLAYLIGAHYPNRDFHVEALTQSGATACA